MAKDEREDLPMILTTAEAAKLLRVTVTTLKSWMRAGKLPGAFKLPGEREWRIRRDDLLAWIDEGTKGGRKD